MPTLAEVNALDRDAFTALFAGVFEHSPWVPETAWAQRPFADVDTLHAAMVGAVDDAGRDAGVALIRAHPDLAGSAAAKGELTKESTREQAAAGVDSLASDQRAQLLAGNEAYRERFGFPFVVCAREHTPETILAAVRERLGHAPEAEERTALGEIAKIARLRLDDLVVADPA